MNTIEKIERIILNSGKSTTAFFKEFGLNHNTLGDWKRGKGKPSADIIYKIAEKYNVSADWLLGLTDSPDKKKPTPIEVDLETFEAALKEKGLKASDFKKLSKEQWAVIADIIKNFNQ